jgi:predicted nuclease of predicted toxin-antitoxin system
MILISSTSMFAYTGAEPLKLPITFLLTNAGQGTGRKMMEAQFLATKTFKKGVDFISNAEPGRENSFQVDFTDDQGNLVKAVVVAIGSTAKGLGASGITIDDEIARLNKMIEEIKKQKLMLIAIHIEGQVRRSDSANERSIDAIAPFADYIIVTKDSNFDGKFTKLSTEKGIPLTILENQLEIQKIIRFWYANK